MKAILNFFFECVDGMEYDVNIFVIVDKLDDGTKTKIEDAISSYVDTVENWEYEELVKDVLNSFDLTYEIVRPITFCI